MSELLTQKEREAIRYEVFPYQEAIPLCELGELIDKTQAKTADAQHAKDLNLDSPELRIKLHSVTFTAACFGRYSADEVWDEGLDEATQDYADQIIAIIKGEK